MEIKTQMFLRNLASSVPPFQKHIEYMTDLKNNHNFNPKVIYDIGSCVMHWTHAAKKVWPDAEYILFDASDAVEFLYLENNYKHNIGVLSDEDDKVVGFYQSDMHPFGNSYYKEIGHSESSKVYCEASKRELRASKLDTIVAKKQYPLPDFVKIDVQGAEMDIIKGGIQTLKNAKHMIIEMQNTDYNENAPKVTETLPFIESLGFKCTHPMLVNNGPDADYAFMKI